MLWFYVIIFLASCSLLILSGRWLVDALARIAIVLSLKEFVVGFFIMAIGTTIPNMIIGIVSALNKVPELSFGDVVGANIFDLTVVVGLAALISRAGLSSHSKTVQGSSIFSIIIAILPLILVLDGVLSRVDGLILLLSFVLYSSWLFSKKDRFTKVYDGEPKKISIPAFLKDVGVILAGIIMLLLGGEGIVKSAEYFSSSLNLPLGLIGIFVVAIGTCMPETFFCLHAAKKGHDWMILGNLMGNVVITATLVLGVVSLVQPINVSNISYFAVARFFLLAATIFFFFFLKSGNKITRKEGIYLLAIYLLFIAAELLLK